MARSRSVLLAAVRWAVLLPTILACLVATAAGRGDERFRPKLDTLSPYQTFVVRRIADGVRRAANLLEPDLVRNPALALAGAVHDAAPAGERSRIHPLSAAWTTSHLHAGQFTAACGVKIHRGDGLPESYRGDAFTCDPTGNLVHRARLEREGVAYASLPDGPEAEPREFLASPSDWFRPVGIATGPDGCLYVADMCRAVIEHPDWMPDELKTRPDLRHGDDHGRIWRIVPDTAARRAAAPRLGAASGAELVALLDHADGWHRDTAARLLLERGDMLLEKADTAVADGLRRQARAGAVAAGRAQALHLLARLGALDDATLRAVLTEAGGAVTLRQQDGKEVTLGRAEIDTISTGGVSLMPVGMERSITVPEMADLIVFIKGWRYGGNGLPPPASTARVQP
jgi:hypothetical protein